MTKRLDTLLDANHSLHPQSLAALEADDFAAAMVEATGGASYGRRIRALEVIALGDAPDAPALLQRLVRDKDQDSRLRSAAARGLRSFPGSDTEAALLDAMRTADDSMRLKLAATLARIGEKRALGELSQLAKGSATGPLWFAAS